MFSVNTEEFVGQDGRVTALKVHEVTMEDGKFVKVEGSDFELEADLVLLAMGFVGPEKPGLLTDLGVKLTDRGNVARGADFDTSVPGVFVAGDMGRGPVVDRLGDRRGPGGRGRSGPLSDGLNRASGADQADCGAAYLKAREATPVTPETWIYCSAFLPRFARRWLCNRPMWASSQGESQVN